MDKSKNQPEREILENGENPEIRKIRNNKPKFTKPELPKVPPKGKKVRKMKFENTTAQAKANSEQTPGKRNAKRRV